MPSISEGFTAQGYDLQFGINVLGMIYTVSACRRDRSFSGHFYLTKLLLPILLSTASNRGTVRVINASSAAHYGGLWNPLDFRTLKDSPRRKRWPTEFLYMQSKFVGSNLCSESKFSYLFFRQMLSSLMNSRVDMVTKDSSPLL